MKRQRLKVELTLLGPILTQSSTAGEPVLDAPAARDADGKVMLTYSLVKGKVLDAFYDLYEPNDARLLDLLGKKNADGHYEPERGRLSFSDFVAVTPECRSDDHDGIIERIAIDAETGSVSHRMLAMLEAPFGYEQEVKFLGRVDFIAGDDEARTIRAELQKAFDLVWSYGAMRTVGFGRKKKVELSLDSTPAARATSAPAQGPLLAVRYRPDRPLCLVGRKHGGNHFESLDGIPGQVLKGAAARLLLALNGHNANVIAEGSRLGRFPTLARHFEAVRFGEAAPMKSDARHRPVEPPLSLVVVPGTKGTEWFDVALQDKPRAVRLAADGKTTWAAPAFLPDWKDEDRDAIRKAFGWSAPPRERRVRTSIECAKWKAKEEALFSYGVVLPRKGKDEFVWEGAIGLHDVPEQDQAAVRSELAELLAGGLPNLGKTRAIAGVEWLSQRTEPEARSQAPAEGLHVVTLQTDCLMTEPRAAEKDLKEAYRDFWAEVSGSAFRMVRFFARQSLHGGYVALRSNRQHYQPFLLTDRGSTFVLQSTGTGNPNKLLDDWAETGLPEPAWIGKFYGTPGTPLWRSCPFLPHVGYGEVAVDLECHTTRKLP